MNDTDHKTKSSSTACPVCQEWQRDMKGTLAALNREQGVSRRMLDTLKKCEQRIVQLCDLVNAQNKLAGGDGRKVRVEDFADIARAAIAEATTAIGRVV